jgi:hypothetical protein
VRSVNKWLPTLASGVVVGVVAAYVYAAGLKWTILLLGVFPLIYLGYLWASGVASLNIRFVHAKWTASEGPELKLIKECNSTFAFMTITGRTSLHRADIEAAIKQRATAKQCKFRFLLLNPESGYLEPFCRNEGSSAEQTRDKIIATTRALLRLASENALDVEVRWYDEYPIWRIVFVDDAVVHVGYYERGRKGYEGPRLVCPQSRHGGLYVPFLNTLEQAWENGVDPHAQLAV